MNYFLLVLSIFILGSFFGFGLEKISRQKTDEYSTYSTSYQSQKGLIFLDDMNRANSTDSLEARGWTVLDVDGGGIVSAFWTGNPSVFPAYEGPAEGYVASNYNGANALGVIDHWLISPEITVSVGDTLRFWQRSPNFPLDDSIYVRYSTTAGVTPSDFDQTWGRYVTSKTGWEQWVGTFNHSGTIRFAIQYYIFDGGPSGNNSNYIGLDLIEVVEAGTNINHFFEDFELFAFPGKVACYDPVNWVTWSNQPCTTEDADISTNYAHSGTKSFVIQQLNDLVKPLGDKTTGHWYVSWWMYIPTGKYGYFNTLNTWPASAAGHWGMEVYFGYDGPSGPPTPGQAHLLAFNPAQVDFPFVYDEWFMITIYVNLDTDLAEFWIVNTIIHQWQWTRGDPSTYANRLAANDFYGASQTDDDECYYDDYWIGDNPVSVKPEDQEAISVNFNLEQNYPNPFNPSTSIKYSVPESGNIRLSVFNIVGEEVAVLVDGFSQAGFYEVTFDASNLSTGVYLYKLQSANSVQTKKMMLLK